MGKHKASEKLVVVRHEPGRARKQRIFFLMILLIVTAAAYYAGAYSVKFHHQRAIERLASLSEEFRSVQSENLALSQQVANLERNDAITKRAKQEIQDTIRELKAEIALLKKDVNFYQGIMAPGDNSKGLQVQRVELAATSENRRYAYKIVLAQVADNRNYVSGVVAVNLVGKQGDEQLFLPLRDVSEVEELGMKFRFRYFQEFTGELTLPEGFEVEQLQVVAQSKGKSASKVEQTSQWAALLSAG